MPNSSPLHRSRRRRFVTSCPGGPLLSPPHRRLQPLRLLVAEGALLLPPPPLQLGHNSSLHYGRSVELAAGDRRSPPTPLPSPWSARAGGVPETGDPELLDPALQEMVTASLLPPEEGRVENLLFPFCSGTQNFNKRAVSFSSGSQEGEDGSVRDLVSTLPSPSLFASGQQGPVRGRDAFSHIPCPTMEPGQCHTTHSDPTSRRTAFRVGHLCSISLPHRGYVSDSPGPACTVPGGLARAPQAVSLAPEDYQTRLRDSVRPASPQVQGHSVHLSVDQGCPCLACRSRGPTGEGRYRAGPSSRDEVKVLLPLLHRTQERRWVTTNPGPARSEPGPSQAPVQDVDAETHLSMRPSLRLVCSNRPEGRLLPCLDPPSTQTVSPLCVRGASIPVQGPSLRAIPVASCLHQGRRSSPCTIKGSRHSYPQLILAQSRALLCEHRDMVLSHLSQLGLQVNREKSKLSPTQRISFLGMELDSVKHTARLSEERAQSMLRCLESLQRKRAVPLKHFQRLLGHMATSAAITPLGLLYMRPLQRWLHDWVPRWAWRHGTYRVSLTPSCRRTFSPWSDLAFLRAGVPLEQVSRHVVVSTDASATGWGAMCNGHAATVAYQLPRVAGSMACSAPLQSAATREACTGPLGQHCDRCVHQPPGRSTLPSHVATRPPSPPLESEASEVASCHSCPRRAQPCSRQALTSARPSGRMATPPWGTPADLETLWGRSGRPVCLPGHVSLPVVFLPVRGDPRYRCAGMQLTSGLTQICVSPSEPSRTDPVQGQGGRGASPLGGALLAQPDVVSRTDAPRDSPSLANSSEEGSTFSERGHPLAPAPRLVESPRMVLGRDAEVLSGLPPAVVNTIASARALSTRQAYRLKWNLFVDWCSPRREDPRRCPIAVVLSFLQDGLERRLSPSTLKVYVAAIAAHHDAVDGKSLGKHDLVIRFLRGARRLNPPRPHLVPSWDLPSVLSALRGAPFEPLQSVELKFLSLKTVLLSALATVKRVGDLQAFSVDDSCLEFGPADSHVVLRPRPGYVPKVPTMPFRDQVANLQALPREEADTAIALLCPVRALRIYVDRTQSFRTSDQLFVCFGGQQKGRAVSKQRLAHWIVEAIVLAYQAQRLPCPLGVRAHSTRGVASSWALARGASIGRRLGDT